MTIIDWMFEHPWMTFFICLGLLSIVSNVLIIINNLLKLGEIKIKSKLK